MNSTPTVPVVTGLGMPRSMVIAQAWESLGDGVEPLSNAAGRPLARTVRLILDPLVIRPVQNPQLGSALVSVEAAEALGRRVTDAADDLRSTAAWFLQLKKARRRLRITEGNPQDLYFQRCFELARLHGAPPTHAAATATEALTDIHDSTERVTVADLRTFITDPHRSGELQQLLARTWAAADRVRESSSADELRAFLDGCATAPDTARFDALIRRGAGTGAAAALTAPGAARALGLTAHATVRPPVIGVTASKSALPPPFDRSILERLFAGLAALARRAHTDSLDDIVTSEIRRTAGAWQLADEPSRLVLVGGREASTGIGGTAGSSRGGDAGARLRSRWQREPFVRRAMRLPAAPPEATGVQEAFMRRLWVRLHGRELRGEPVAAEQAWDLIDGALRSVVLDRRDRVKTSLERNALVTSGDTAPGAQGRSS